MIIFFSLLVLVTAFGELSRIDLGNGVAFTLLDIFAAISFFIFCILTIKAKHHLFTPPTKPLIIFLGIAVISLLINMPFLSLLHSGISALYLVRFVAYCSIFFITYSIPQKIKHILPILLVGSGTIVLGAGFLQYFYYPSLRNLYYLGWDEHLYRLFSTFLDPNFTGIYLVLSFLVTLHFFIQQFSKKSRITTLVLGVLVVAFTFGIFLTYSRSAYLALGISLITFVIFQKKLRMWLLGALVFLFVGMVLISLYPKKTEGTDLFRTASSFARIQSDQAAITIWSKEPILGTGFNTYRYAQESNGLLKGANRQTSHSGAGVENSELFVLATTGIIGFGSFIYFYFSLFKNAFIQRKTNNLALTIFVSLVAILTSSLFINSLFYPPLLVWQFILAGLLVTP